MAKSLGNYNSYYTQPFFLVFEDIIAESSKLFIRANWWLKVSVKRAKLVAKISNGEGKSFEQYYKHKNWLTINVEILSQIL